LDHDSHLHAGRCTLQTPVATCLARVATGNVHDDGDQNYYVTFSYTYTLHTRTY
jgi:hypothetical protein